MAQPGKLKIPLPRGATGVILMTLLFLAVARPARAEIRYSVSLADRAGHLFDVGMTVPNVRGHLRVAMPAWNGLYQIRDFAERVEDVRASQDRRSLAVRPIDGQRWEIAGAGTIHIQYRVFWNQPGPFSSQLNSHHAFVNFAEILFYVPGRRREGAQVRFLGVPANWKIAVELPPGPCAACFEAAGYDALADAPAEAGTFTEFRLVENRAHLRVAVDATGGASWNRKQLEGWLEKIVGYETGMMREAPFREYLFIYHIGPGAGGGGMEHANSTAIAVEDASEIPAVTAHEFFHLWNVKRIRPESLNPVDYARPQWTRSLWFVEGVTSTYAAYTMLRTGLWTRERYYQHLGNLISQLQSRPARLWQSVEESSLDAWFEKYPFYNQPQRSISYYDKGELDGVLLDILVRDATGNRRSLDDVMRYMNRTYALRNRFYHGNAAIEAAVEKIAGRSFAGFFENYVSGTAAIPWNRILGRAGLRVSISRGEQQLTLPLTLGHGGATLYNVSPVENPSERQRRILDGLLHGRTD
ncbi:MAG TPA: hypothetical protein VNJ52_13845 [Patescibacteria group bacterium]|nr:hypothetical protein [Patescibacteria group bacterium]